MKLCILIAILLTSSCSDRKRIRGSYYITILEEGVPSIYYIEKKGVDSGGGVFDGIIKRVGWKGDELLADVQRLSSSDVSGWYKLNLRNGEVSGPLTDPGEISSFEVIKVEDFYRNPMKYRK